MTKKITFKAFHKERRKLYDVASIDLESRNLFLFNENHKMFNVNIEEIELLQFNGKKDKNGVEIYIKITI